jgi:hypothetical protein
MRLGSICQLNPAAWMKGWHCTSTAQALSAESWVGLVRAMMESQACCQIPRFTCKSSLFLSTQSWVSTEIQDT